MTELVGSAEIVDNFMQSAEGSIDAQFGSGHAAKYPTLVAGYLQACAIVHLADSFGSALGQMNDEMSNIRLQLERLADYSRSPG